MNELPTTACPVPNAGKPGNFPAPACGARSRRRAVHFSTCSNAACIGEQPIEQLLVDGILAFTI
ncbi:MAG: hypothetical protein KF688_19840, partial [Pirellulales bacterium]|nr:hypothetical protein [Pirellulales bacterium]